MLRQFGLPDKALVAEAQSASFHADNIYTAVMDEPALWDPSTIEDIVRDFPENLVPEADLYLILSECFANTAFHGRAQALGIHARRRGNILLLSFFQSPPMLGRVAIVLTMAKSGSIADYMKDEDFNGGLGFPILLRLTRNITISRDYTKLQLWLEVTDTPSASG